MTNPNDAVGTNAAYGTRTSVNAFNDFAQLVNGRGVLSGWAVSPKTGMTLNAGGVAGTRDVAIAEDNLGNRTTVDNRSGSPIEVELEAASASSNRYDAIVVYVNNPAQADDDTPDAPSVCGIIAVQGGTTGVSEQQIRAAISADGGTGSVAYYAVLATVYIAAGTTTITSGNISQTKIYADVDPVIETTSNGQTSWKYPDGRLICFGKKSDTYNITGAYNNSFYADTSSIFSSIFATPFISTPVVNVSVKQASNLITFNFRETTSTGFAGYIWTQKSTGNVSVEVDYYAVGRWKA